MKKFGVVSDLLSGVSLAEKDPAEMDITWLKREQIIKNPQNGYEIGDVRGLAADIRRAGIAQPLEVLPQPDGSTYRLLTGERRLTAVDLLIAAGDWKPERKIPCVVRSLADYENLALSDDLKEMYAIIRTNRFNRKLSDADLYFEAEQWEKIIREMKANGQKELTLGIDQKEESLTIDLSGRTRENVAKTLQTSNGQVAKIESIRKRGIKPVKDAVSNGQLKIAPAYILSGMSEEEQQEFMEKQDGIIRAEDVTDFCKSKQQQKSQKKGKRKADSATDMGMSVEKVKYFPETTIRASIRKYEHILNKLQQEPNEDNAADINETEMLLEGLKLLLMHNDYEKM